MAIDLPTPAASGRTSPHGGEENNLEHMKGLDGFAEVRDVARRYDDDRGRRYCDIFGTVTGDINITHAYPGVTTAWHAHNRQYDEWFVIKGALKVGLAIPNGDGTFRWRFVSLSEFDGKVLRILPGVLHGWRNHTNEEAVLMYHISEKYDPNNPDEIRYSIEQVGADWSTIVR
jgi:dTDP-4-dehydrorhamnose 3,5-epimerase-like enzyme